MALVTFFPHVLRKRIIYTAFRLTSGIAYYTTGGIDHDLKFYEKVVSPFISFTSTLRSGYEGLFTARFSIVYLDEVGAKVCKCDEDIKKNVIGILRNFYKEFEENREVSKKVNLLRKLLADLKTAGFIEAGEDEDFVRVACEEMIHGSILDGTSLHKLVDVVSWEERFLLMYITEIVHRALGDVFPRNPELFWIKGLNDDEIEKVLSKSREFLEKNENVKRRLEEAFKELYFKMFFKSIFYSSIVLPFVEVPTWVILEKFGLIDKDEIKMRIDERFGAFSGDENFDRLMREQKRIANEVYQSVEALEVEKVIPIVKKSLNMPIEDVRTCLVNEKAGQEISRLSNNILERLKNVVKGHDVSIYEAKTGIQSLLMSLRIFKMKDLTKVFSDILSEEPEVLRCVAFHSARPRRLGIILMSIRDKCIILYDPWTMEESEDICGGIFVRRTGRKLSTMEDLIGSTPLVLRGYLMLRHYLLLKDESFIEVIRMNIGVDRDTWKSYTSKIESFHFIDMVSKDAILNMNSAYAIDCILGLIYTFAKLGENATRLAGLHGIHII